MIKRIPLADIYPVMTEVLSSGGEFNMITAGTSMLPMLRDRRDTAVLVKPTFPVKKYDVILYRRPDGTFVLHRVVGKNKSGYILCGDNQYLCEYGIAEDQIIATLRAYIKDGKRIECSSLGHRAYTIMNCVLRPVRKRALGAVNKVKKWLKK